MARTEGDAIYVLADEARKVRPEHEAKAVEEAREHGHLCVRHLQLAVRHDARHDEHADDVIARRQLRVEVLDDHGHDGLPALVEDVRGVRRKKDSARSAAAWTAQTQPYVRGA